MRFANRLLFISYYDGNESGVKGVAKDIMRAKLEQQRLPEQFKVSGSVLNQYYCP